MKKCDPSRYENSRSAVALTSSLDELVGLRIALQRPLDISQHFPVLTVDAPVDANSTISDFTSERQNASVILQQILKDILNLEIFTTSKEGTYIHMHTYKHTYICYINKAVITCYIFLDTYIHCIPASLVDF